MGLVGNVFLAVVVILLSLSMTFTVLAFNTNGTLLNLGYYRNQLFQNNMYDKISDEIVTAVAAKLVEQVPFAYQADIEGKMKVELKKIFGAKKVQDKLDPLIENTLNYLTSKSDTIDLTVDLTDVKAQITSAAKRIAAQEAANSITDQQRGMIWAAYVHPGGCGSPAYCVTYCSDPAHADECDLGAYVSQIPNNQFTSVGDQVPDSVDLSQQIADMNGGTSLEETLYTPRIILTAVSYFPWIGMFFVLAGIGVIALFGLLGRDIGRIPFGVGIAAALSGIALAALSMLGNMIVPGIAGSALQNVQADVAKFVVSFIGGIFGALMLPGILLLVLGIGLVALSFVMRTAKFALWVASFGRK